MAAHSGCTRTGKGFQSVLDMAYFSVSIVLLSYDSSQSLRIPAGALGFDVSEPASESDFRLAKTYLLSKRHSLLAEYSYEHPSELI
jgi:peroxiredoxin